MPGDPEGWAGGVKLNYGVLWEFSEAEFFEDREGRGDSMRWEGGDDFSVG